MLSVIVCSVSAERLCTFKQNVDRTVGTEYELIVINNREKLWPIARAYNYGASQAKYANLAFIHEDVLFYTNGWGKLLEQKLAEPDCGVIGFAGGKIKLRVYTGWHNGIPEWDSAYYWYRDIKIHDDRLASDMFLLGGEPYDEVVTLDGFALFVRKDVWEKYPFDEQALTGFHGYDLDFSMAIAQHYHNYVCKGIIQVLHLSHGSFDNKWRAEIIRLHRQKWNQFLPLQIKSWENDKAFQTKYEEFLFYKFCIEALRRNYKEVGSLFKEFYHRPLTLQHLRYVLSGSLKRLFYCFKRRTR